MNPLIHRDAIPALNVAHDTGAVMMRLLVGAVSLLWLAAGLAVWVALVVLALGVALLRVPFVLVARLAGRRP